MSSVSVSMYKKIMIQYDGCSLANASLYTSSRESPSWQRPTFSDEQRRVRVGLRVGLSFDRSLAKRKRRENAEII